MGEISLIGKILIIFFSVFIGLIIFMVIFGKKSSSKAYWDTTIKMAIGRNASNLIIEIGKPIQIKVGDEWTNMGPIAVSLKDFNYFQSFLESQSDAWILPESGVAKVIRNESHAVELELQPG